MRARLVALLVFALAWLHDATASAAPEVPEPMHADLVRGLDPEPGELEANVVAIEPLDAEAGPVAWAPEIEWAPPRRAAFELELPFVGAELRTIKLSTQLTLARPRRHRPAQGLLLSASLPLHRHAELQATHVIAAHLGRRFGLVTQLGPRVGIDAVANAARIGAFAGASAFVSLRDGSAIGIEGSWTGERRRHTLELLPQVHVRAAKHVHLQFGLGARHEIGTHRFTAIVGLRVIVER
ncbi:MAG TPA: hypothetical protein VFG69_02125 [Nannocystaceae bacterium]|nr:hypothetical protein [Nannocystaceae bacterium]